jgi:hypothetical protein
MDGFQSQETGVTHAQALINERRRKCGSSQNKVRPPMPVKVADLNSMVVIRKKAPARTFKEKVAHRAEK